jgi:hypothetical protein
MPLYVVIWIVMAVFLICAIVLITIARRRPPPLTPIALVDTERVDRQLQVRPLPAGAREPYLQAWQSLQGRFADEPEATIRESDRLIQRVMRERGYPSGDFGPVTEELSPEDAVVIDNYRILHRISVKSETDFVPPEDVQRAVAALRALFDSLVAS